ncbi:hypothetical protein [Actinotignum sp. GS-2025b]|uniref:hypothetical protein n=1 Tax=Actinotignum sp. GS-2025b TaxID=3427275 RepID=UPI003F48E2E1
MEPNAAVRLFSRAIEGRLTATDEGELARLEETGRVHDRASLLAACASAAPLRERGGQLLYSDKTGKDLLRNLALITKTYWISGALALSASLDHAVSGTPIFYIPQADIDRLDKTAATWGGMQPLWVLPIDEDVSAGAQWIDFFKHYVGVGRAVVDTYAVGDVPAALTWIKEKEDDVAV